MKTHRLPVFGTILLLFSLASCAPREEDTGAPADADAGAAAVEPAPDAAAAAQPTRARAELQGAPDSGVSGNVEATEEAGGVRLVAEVSGVAESGPHGFHVHQVGSCEPPDFTSAGDHFDPTGAPHACPPTTPRHAGDLGNLEVEEGGSGRLELSTDLLTVSPGPSSLVGKAIILHAGADDCTTQPSGDSGDRLACGVFEQAD